MPNRAERRELAKEAARLAVATRVSPECSAAIQQPRECKRLLGMPKREFLITVGLTAFQIFLPAAGIQENFWLAAALWVLILGLAVHILWESVRASRGIRLACSAMICIGGTGLVRVPLARQWEREHAPVGIPHIQATLVLDEIPSKGSPDYHLVLENIGEIQIDEIRCAQSALESAILESLPIIPRTLAPKARLSINGIPFNGLEQSRTLFAQFTFKTHAGHKVFTSGFRYSLSRQHLKPQIILPDEIQELSGDYVP